MSTEQKSSVVFRVPDFVDADGIAYTDIEVVVEMDGDIRSTAELVKTLERPIGETASQMKKAAKLDCVTRKGLRIGHWTILGG
jgi:hypothetical protein